MIILLSNVYLDEENVWNEMIFQIDNPSSE